MPDKLLQKMQDAYNRVAKEAAAGVYGKRIVPNQDGKGDDSPGARPDFPYVEDPEGYTTHVPIEGEDVEDDSKEKIKEDSASSSMSSTSSSDPSGSSSSSKSSKSSSTTIQSPEQAGEDAGSEMPEGPGGGDEGIGGMGMDAEGNMPGVEAGGGLGQQEEEKLTSSQIGRVYELKKIYSRLASVETFLARTTDETILDIRKLVSQSIDLFEVVISNYDQYKDKVDDIIITYYEFLDVVYGSIKTYFSGMSKE